MQVILARGGGALSYIAIRCCLISVNGSRCNHKDQYPLLKEFMKSALVTVSLVGCLAIFSQAAEAKGCLTGAAVGGVAGHVVGEHGVLGAAVGCAIGRHKANKKAKQEAAQSTADQDSKK